MQEAGAAAIGPLIAVLADPARAAEHANVRTALAEMGRARRRRWLAIVEQADPKLAVQAILTLGGMNDATVAAVLLGRALSEKSDPADARGGRRRARNNCGATLPSRADSRPGCSVGDAKSLLRAARADRGRGRRQGRSCGDGTRQRGNAWPRAARRTTRRGRWPPARARDAYALAPDDPIGPHSSIWRRCSKRRPTKTVWIGRLDAKNPAAVEADRFGVKPIEEVLKYAMARDRPAAAAAAARLLGEIGTAGELL